MEKTKENPRLLLREALCRDRCRGTLLSLLCLLLGKTLLLSGLLGSEGLSAVVLAHGLQDGLLLLWLDDGDGVGEGLLGAGLALGVGTAHDLNLETEDTLTEEDVAGSGVDEFLGGVTGVDHEAVLYSKVSISQMDLSSAVACRVPFNVDQSQLPLFFLPGPG